MYPANIVNEGNISQGARALNVALYSTNILSSLEKWDIRQIYFTRGKNIVGVYMGIQIQLRSWWYNREIKGSCSCQKLYSDIWDELPRNFLNRCKNWYDHDTVIYYNKQSMVFTSIWYIKKMPLSIVNYNKMYTSLVQKNHYTTGFLQRVHWTVVD